MSEGYLKENKSIISAVSNVLNDRSKTNPLLLFKMFINKIYVFSNEVKIDVFMFDYLDELPKEQIYIGDEIA